MKGRYARAAQAGQQPLFTPDSVWTPPQTLPDWRRRPLIAVDTETKDDWLSAGQGAGWAVGAGHVVGVCAAVGAGTGERIYVPLRHPDTENFPRDQVIRWLDDHLRCGARVVMQKSTYDVGWIQADFGLDSPAYLDDTMIMSYMLDENHLSYGLDAICERLGIEGKDESLLREAAATYGVDPKAELWRLPARYVGAYGEQDAVSTLLARERMWPAILEEDLQDAYQLEIDLVPMIVAMRRRGIRIDLDRADQLRGELRTKRDVVLAELAQRIGVGQISMKDVRSTSFKQKCFDAENLPYPRTPPSARFPEGQPSFEAKKLAGLQHWLPQLLIKATRYEDAGEKFVANYIQGYASRGRIHAEIHSTKDVETEGDGGGGTVSTRLAYSDPPLQQMPSRDPELGPAIRGLFLPEPGEVWYAPDYSQQEFRLYVHFAYVCGIAGAEDAVRVYRENPAADFHNIVVDLTGLARKPAKDVNFAKAFRAGVPKFAEMTGKSLDEAKLLYEQYDEKMPFVSRFAEYVDGRAQKRGYVRLVDGARAHFDRWEPRWLDRDARERGWRSGAPMAPCTLAEARRRVGDSAHPWHRCQLKRAFTFKAVNRLIQGSAARQTKLAMRACWREGIVPLIQMHDELGASLGERRTADRMAEIMRDVVKLSVPVMVDQEFGVTWGEARKIESPNKDVLYGASWEEAQRRLTEAPWW